MPLLLVIPSEFNQSHYRGLIGQTFPTHAPPGFAQVKECMTAVEYGAHRLEKWAKSGPHESSPPILQWQQDYGEYLELETQKYQENKKEKKVAMSNLGI